ncbi:hypothetical protein K0M31_001458 [Melipona bicolor]|uniref:Uncharacterized protein n=1 Tax=Melipona bicolor TaxID=60889 RepID=A0AA40KXS7_9HYME|nr:hypothetical protein K0M31_001458 [Melipona bicolor]
MYPAAVRDGVPCSPSGVPPEPLPDLNLFTNILADRRWSETENGRECARPAKAENVGPYENPFRLKNGLVGNPLGAQGRKGAKHTHTRG